MKKVLSAALSLAMTASFATGFAVMSSAEEITVDQNHVIPYVPVSYTHLSKRTTKNRFAPANTTKLQNTLLNIFISSTSNLFIQAAFIILTISYFEKRCNNVPNNSKSILRPNPQLNVSPQYPNIKMLASRKK